jgi:hypothetical protein
LDLNVRDGQCTNLQIQWSGIWASHNSAAEDSSLLRCYVDITSQNITIFIDNYVLIFAPQFSFQMQEHNYQL